MSNWKLFFALLFIPFFHQTSFSQGSGNCIEFDGTDDYVAVKNNFPNQVTSFSISAWIFTVNNTKTGQRIFIDDANNSGGYGFSLGEPGTGRLRFYWRMSTLFVLDASIATAVGRVENSTWYHAAVTVNTVTNTVIMYLNGVQVASNTYTVAETFDAGDASIGGENNASTESGSGFKFSGRLDEVIYWNKALSLTEIRNVMCAKQSTTDADILGYWNFDNVALGTDNVPDIKAGNIFPGTLTNVASLASSSILSGAALGDVSTNLYPTNWLGQTLTLGSTSNGSVTIQNVTTNSGMHIYRVDAVPSSVLGLSGLGTNNRYWGIYSANVATAAYDEVFDYSNYPDALTNEINLNLFYRQKNDQPNWNNRLASQNLVANTFIASVLNERQELILTNPASPLPIELIRFEARLCAPNNCIFWETATEINNEKFILEKSDDGINFKELAAIPSQNGNANYAQAYRFVDSKSNAFNYYRLKQIDIDGQFTYSEIIFIGLNSNPINVYPNPFRDMLYLTGADDDCTVHWYDLTGRLNLVQKYFGEGILMPNLPEGFYYLELLKGQQVLLRTRIQKSR
jgi:hypothetical protein